MRHRAAIRYKYRSCFEFSPNDCNIQFCHSDSDRGETDFLHIHTSRKCQGKNKEEPKGNSVHSISIDSGDDPNPQRDMSLVSGPGIMSPCLCHGH